MASDDDDLKTTIRCNTLLGMWAAGKLGLVDEQAELYAKDLAVGAIAASGADAFGKIRKDFDRAGLILPDEEILRAMEDSALQAHAQLKTARRDSVDAAAVMLKRKLTTA